MKRRLPHIIVLGLVVVVLLTGSHPALRNFVTDIRFSFFPREATGDVVLVEIDSDSIEKVGVWPWPRRLHAEIIGKLHEAGASEIAFDIDFSSSSGDKSDLVFADALRKAGGSVVLPSFMSRTPDDKFGKSLNYARPLAKFGEHSWSALVNVPLDPDGLIRRYSYGDHINGSFVPSLGGILGGQLRTRSDTFLIDYSIRSNSVPTIRYVDVLHGDDATLKRIFSNKKAIIGATALELGDRVYVPRGQIISGAMLQALAAESILLGRALQMSSAFMALAGALAIMAMMLVTWGRLSFPVRAVLLVGAAAATELGAVLLQANWPFVLDTSILHLAILGYLVAGALYEIDLRGLLSRIAERRFQRVAMSMGDGLACVDRNGSITFWNPGAATIFGYESCEMIGESLWDVLAREDFDGSDETVKITSEILKSAGGEVIELKGRRRNGQLFPVEARLFGWEGAGGFEYGALLRDISTRKREAERIQYLAHVDSLTGLANRHTMREHLDAMLMDAEAERSQAAVLVLDLDKFKDINDSLGHTSGDELLTAVAGRLRNLLTGTGLVARLGGDEFAVLINAPDAVASAARLADQIFQTFKKDPFSVHGRQMQVRCSIGIAIYPDDATSPDQLLGNADLALYQAKAEGGGKRCFFSQDIRNALNVKLSLQQELEWAIKRNELELFYQPQVSLVDGQLIGAESLIRWRHPKRGLLSPAEFMPVVHASTFSNDIAWWVLETACNKASEWQRQGHHICVGVNLSPSQLQSKDLAGTVAGILEKTGLSPHLLELEVTEDILLSDDDRAGESFARLRELGVRLSYDDFGTGYGSLSYLKKYPLDRLKIDRSFVLELAAGTDDAAIVNSTIALGKSMGLAVIAEGIENAGTVDLLIGMGCSEGQGYHFGRPAPASEFERRWLSAALIGKKMVSRELAANAA